VTWRSWAKQELSRLQNKPELPTDCPVTPTPEYEANQEIQDLRSALTVATAAGEEQQSQINDLTSKLVSSRKALAVLEDEAADTIFALETRFPPKPVRGTPYLIALGVALGECEADLATTLVELKVKDDLIDSLQQGNREIGKALQAVQTLNRSLLELGPQENQPKTKEEVETTDATLSRGVCKVEEIRVHVIQEMCGQWKVTEELKLNECCDEFFVCESQIMA